MSSIERRSRRRLVWSGTVAAAVVASALSIPTSGAGSGTPSLSEANEATKAALGVPHQDPPGTPPHNHNDPATKNLISRAGEVGRNAQDPTTAAERTAAAAYVASERRLPDPQLRKAPLPSRAKVPPTRYAMANGCYTLAGQPIFFKPTTLGVYLLYDKQRRFVVAGGGRAAAPGPATEWTARKVGDRFAFTNAGKRLRINGTDRFALRVAKGCTRYPEADINIHGAPFAGVYAVPGGARVRRRAHPRDGVRVPRRQGALRPALARVRRAVRPEGLPRPRPHPGLRRDPRDVLLRTGRATTRSAGRRSRTGRRPTR